MQVSNKKNLCLLKKKSRQVYNKKIRVILSFSFTILLFILFCFACKTIYIKMKCRNLNYAVNYELSNNDLSEVKLLRVKNSKLLFLNDSKAVVKAYGLSKDKPHRQTTLECHLTKNFFNSWELENAYKISTCN